MGKYSFVLSDDLFKEYMTFKNQGDFNKEIIHKILRFYKGEFLSNIEQIERTGVAVTETLRIGLNKAGFRKGCLEDLARKTEFKLVLSSDKSSFPYVNINGDNIEHNITGSFHRNHSREKAVSHIKSLCEEAKEIYIYDKYFSEITGNSNIELFKKIFPQKSIKIQYSLGVNSMEDVTILKKICSEWQFISNDNMLTHHDRYLIVDNKIEIILTSGFEHLGREIQEFSYIVRPISTNRLLNQ